MLDASAGIQWPLPEGRARRARSAERRLFDDGRFFHADGRARFSFEAPRPLPEPTDDALPVLLLTGRGSSSQWHTQTRTASRRCCASSTRDDVVRRDQPRRRASGSASGPSEWVRRCESRARRDRRAARSSRTSCSRARSSCRCTTPSANQLTFAAFDPYSRQPSYKACAVASSASNTESRRASRTDRATRLWTWTSSWPRATDREKHGTLEKTAGWLATHKVAGRQVCS